MIQLSCRILFFPSPQMKPRSFRTIQKKVHPTSEKKKKKAGKMNQNVCTGSNDAIFTCETVKN